MQARPKLVVGTIANLKAQKSPLDFVRTAALAMLTGGLQGVAIRHLRWSLRARSYVTAVAVA